MERKTGVLLYSSCWGHMLNKRIDLEKNLLDLHVVLWEKRKDSIKVPERQNQVNFHVIGVKANPTEALRRALPYLKFSIRTIKLLKKLSPSVIHVLGLDMLMIAGFYKTYLNHSAKIIYEVVDLHKLLIDKQTTTVKKLAQKILLHEDRKLTKKSELLIVTSEKFLDIYFNIICPDIEAVMLPNVPIISAFSEYERKAEKGNFTIGYFGSIRYKEQIRMLIDATEITKINVLFAGVESEPIEIEPLCRNKKNITWKGRFDYVSQISDLYEQCDVTYCVYNADMRNVRIALPNKLYESILCELPIIVAKGTYLAELVERLGVGIAVDHHNVNDLVNALIRLRDDADMYNELVANCRKNKNILDAEKSERVIRERISEWTAGD